MSRTLRRVAKEKPWCELFAAVFFLALSPIAGCSSTEAPGTRKAVLVTGASTGIGRKITERLAKDGYFVYAGARKPEDIKDLSAIPNVQGLRLDVTKPDEIAAAVDAITNAKRGLYGLVNNAGVLTVSPAMETPWSEFDLVMAVNTYGPVRVTKAFFPLIKASRGRIINIGSIMGVLTAPNGSAYAMSKHAMEAFTDALAQELWSSGVRASIIEPGRYASNLIKSAMTREGDSHLAAAAAEVLPEPDDVAVAAEKALTEKSPKRRYMVVPNQNEAGWTIRKQIEQLVQLNEDQPYAYDRDALIKMLDQELAKAHATKK